MNGNQTDFETDRQTVSAFSTPLSSRRGYSTVSARMTGSVASSTVVTNTHPQKNTVPVAKKAFIGRLQPCSSRLPGKPMVNFEKGGSDFRCPTNTSCLGRQVLSGKHQNTGPRVNFASAPRFVSSETIGVGPAALGEL